jgi:hypothetical protein
MRIIDYENNWKENMLKKTLIYMELQFLTFCYKRSCQKGQCVAKTICGKFGLITLCQK